MGGRASQAGPGSQRRSGAERAGQAISLAAPRAAPRARVACPLPRASSAAPAARLDVARPIGAGTISHSRCSCAAARLKGAQRARHVPAVRHEHDCRTSRSRSSADAVLRVLARVARLGFDPAQRPPELALRRCRRRRRPRARRRSRAWPRPPLNIIGAPVSRPARCRSASARATGSAGWRRRTRAQALRARRRAPRSRRAGLPPAAACFSAAMRIGGQRGGGCEHDALQPLAHAPLQAPSQSRRSPASTSIQPRNRCQSIRRAPTSISSSSGTGGSSSAASTGFQDSMPSIMKDVVHDIDTLTARRDDCAARLGSPLARSATAAAAIDAMSRSYAGPTATRRGCLALSCAGLAVARVAALLLFWAAGLAGRAADGEVAGRAALDGAARARGAASARSRFSPWSLRADVEQSAAWPRRAGAGAPPQLQRRARCMVNADLRSLLRLAPVIEAMEIDAPGCALARTGRRPLRHRRPARALQAPAAPTPANDEPARFALYNLRLHDGAVEFDDRPVKRQHRSARPAAGAALPVEPARPTWR